MAYLAMDKDRAAGQSLSCLFPQSEDFHAHSSYSSKSQSVIPAYLLQPVLRTSTSGLDYFMKNNDL